MLGMSGGTLDRVRDGTVRVGAVVDTPWVTDSAGTVGGVEAALVGAIARDIGARVEWVRNTESALLRALHDRELDLVVGGLTEPSPWSHEVALTRPYYTHTVGVGGAPGSAPPPMFRGRQVAVKAGDPTAAELRRAGAHPRPVADLRAVDGPVAAPSWQLAALGRIPAGRVLREDRHVLATAPGENAWLVHVERQLRAHESRVPAMLRASRP
jgi:ABC-type amino acid transport substrate-binding protein